MGNPYRALFQAPGTKAFAVAGLVARMPISMTGIGIITMLALVRGSYGLAGAVAATFALAMALLAPQISRLADRHGQRKVLPVAAAISVAGTLALLLCTHLQAPTWTLFVCAALAGCMPSMPAMVRARWTEIYRGRPELQTAYALESVLDELCFIVGPPLSVLLCVSVFAEGGPLIAALLLAGGVSALVAQRRTEPPVHARQADGGSAIRLGIVRLLMLTMLAMGVIVGTIDVVSVALAQQQGQPAAASVVLSVYALSSCLAGLAFGIWRPALPLARLFLYGGIGTALTTLPLLLASDIVGLALAVFLAGAFFAPTIIAAMALVEAGVPSAKLTEGLTWLITGLGIGVAAGAALSGWVIDAYGPQAGSSVALGAGVALLLAGVYGRRALGAAPGAVATRCNG